MIADAKVRLFLESCKFFIIFFVFLLSYGLILLGLTDGAGERMDGMCSWGMGVDSGRDGENRAHGGVLEGVFSGVWSFVYV